MLYISTCIYLDSRVSTEQHDISQVQYHYIPARTALLRAAAGWPRGEGEVGGDAMGECCGRMLWENAVGECCGRMLMLGHVDDQLHL